MARFLARNPVLKTKRQIYVDSIRVNCARSEVIRPWFQKLDIPAVRAIPANQRWNMDETGIMEGYGLNGYVVGSAEIRKVQGKQPGSRAWTTIIECISATGASTLPLVIYHETTEFLWRCLEHNIYLLFLPAHTSHVLQPVGPQEPYEAGRIQALAPSLCRG